MRPRQLSDLAIFHRIAEERSFTAAADRLGITQSAVSQTLKRLEGDLGVKLLFRTTRSLAPTAAGERLLGKLAPAIDELEAEIEDLRRLSAQPGGRLRVTCGKHAADTLVWLAFSQLIARHPEIDGELSVENRYVDIVAERFDVGIRLHEQLEMDMVAVPIGPPLKVAVVAAPGYLASVTPPHVPQDLASHRCIGFRNATGVLSPWTFEKEKHSMTISIAPDLVVNDGDALIRAACAGLGLVYILEDVVTPQLRDGRLEQVLSDWCAPFPGYHAFYSSRRHPTRAFTLFLDTMRQVAKERSDH